MELQGTLSVIDDYLHEETRRYDLQEIKQIKQIGEKLYVEMKNGYREIIYEGENARAYLKHFRNVVRGLKAEHISEYQTKQIAALNLFSDG